MTDPRPPSDDLAAEIAAHQGCSCLAEGGRHCVVCGEPWKPCLVRRLADAHARCTNLSNAEASRIFEEAREQRERAEKAEAERDALLSAGQAMADRAGTVLGEIALDRFRDIGDFSAPALLDLGDARKRWRAVVREACDGRAACKALAPAAGEDAG